MQRLEVSCAVGHIYIYMSLGAKGLRDDPTSFFFAFFSNNEATTLKLEPSLQNPQYFFWGGGGVKA